MMMNNDEQQMMSNAGNRLPRFFMFAFSFSADSLTDMIQLSLSSGQCEYSTNNKQPAHAVTAEASLSLLGLLSPSSFYWNPLCAIHAPHPCGWNPGLFIAK
jgi:hypothetical protein